MLDTKQTITPDVQRLIDMEDEVIYAKDISPILRIHPQTIIQYAKDGRWNQDNLGKFVISGDRVKFFRKDFLQKCGFIEPEPEEPKQPTEREVILAAISALETILKSQKEVITLLTEQNEMLRARIKPPAAATTDG